ncbi:MAG: 2OG-Fe(II) oxygenase [Micromonosporaceae bacterium]|nr:2OG-Fe(II) oxygenase [Micromonosporaceae bacterium]
MSGPLGSGERAPDFVGPGPSGQPARFYAHAGGRPTALLFHGADDLADRLAGRDDVALWPVTDDPEGRVAAAYGVTDQTTVVVLDPNLRVLEVVSGDRLADRVVELLDRAVHRGPAVPVTGQAPVLLLPGALPAGWCERLIGVWQSGQTVETGVARGDAGEVRDDAYKRRRDHTVRDPELLTELSRVVGRRVIPEVRKAFAYRASRFEGFKIACYDAAAGGFFRPHRDNLTPATAHRVFALTLNLNQEYEGGQLRFPEYGNQLYRPDAGAALVFSCAHLHEVCEVTAGRRFVLLSFLYGEP